MSNSELILFELLQITFGSHNNLSFTPSNKDWSDAQLLAMNHNIEGIVLDAIKILPKHQLPEIIVLMEWVVQRERCKTKHEQHIKTIKNLSAFYQTHDIRMMLLKGYGLSLNYPISSLRYCGDIDIYLFGDIDKADSILETDLSIDIDRDNDHHSVFLFDSIFVENHRTFSDQHNHKSNIRLENLYCDLISEYENVLIEKNVYTPSSTFNAIYLLRHIGEHFASEGLKLRHILDLGTFFKAHHTEIDWDKVLDIYQSEQMKLFYDAIATICVRNMGFNACCFHGYIINNILADKIIEDSFSNKKELQMNTTGLSGLHKILYGIEKTIRWYKNRWKYQIVYKESMWESFFTLALNRLKN